MRIDATRNNRKFHYVVHAEVDDLQEFFHEYDHSYKLCFVKNEYDVLLPQTFKGIHPDVHALAIWLSVKQMVSSTLSLSFPVSSLFAANMEELFGVCFPNVDPAIRPRKYPEQQRPALLFSGGVDSLAAAVVMPSETALLFWDRIPHFPVGQNSSNQVNLIEPSQQKWLCAEMIRHGWDVYSTSDDHDFMYEPYPLFHANFFHLPALYLADSLSLGQISTGDVLCPQVFGGYHKGVKSWQFKKSNNLYQSNSCEDYENQSLSVNSRKSIPQIELPLVGMRFTNPVLGLTEVGTALVVNRSALKGRATSCYFPSNSNYCLRCDKCFKKVLLDYIFDDKEVPASLFEHFLSYSYLADIFSRPIFEWHHIWYYIFQKIRCKHAFVQELNRQATSGPDLSVLEKWYPVAACAVPDSHKDEIIDNILQYVSPMTNRDQAQFENLEVPSLIVPPDLLRKSVLVNVPSTVSSTEKTTENVALLLWDGSEALSAAEVTIHLERLLALSSGETVLLGKCFEIHVKQRTVLIRLTLRGKSEFVLFLVECFDKRLGRIRYQLLYQRLPEKNRNELKCVMRLIATYFDSRCWGEDVTLLADWINTIGVGAALLDRVEQASLSANSEPEFMGGYRVSWPALTYDDRVLVSLNRGSSCIDLYLQERTGDEPCFAMTQKTKISHFVVPAVDSTSKMDTIHQFVNVLNLIECS